ncbi:MAG: leucine-rich repeat domain-containing protein [Clostridia bacterium]|nr:leucine-rich repeat domain-containing protein [Clostridia bacterium]
MKKLTFFAIFFLFALTLCLSAGAQSGSCGENAFWSLEGGTLRITGSGDMEIYDSDELVPWHFAREQIKNLIIDKGITSLGNCAFSGIENITEVTFPEGLETIGDCAFVGCTGLKKVTLPSGIKRIGFEAFFDCISLDEVHAESLEKWCETQFDSASSNPLFYGRNLYFGDALAEEVTLPESLAEIGQYAFTGCTSLKSATAAGQLETVGDSAFNGCSGLQKVVLGENVKKIGLMSFGGCSSLTEIHIPESVEEIDELAFSGCSSLKRLELYGNIKKISQGAFEGCDNLTVYCYAGSAVSKFCKKSDIPCKTKLSPSAVILIFACTVLCAVFAFIFRKKIKSILRIVRA